MHTKHHEHHHAQRVGWLRAAVLGANDGIISIACLIIGVTAANASHPEILLAGTAALVAGALSMAAGEYVSVSSQLDSEKADLDREQRELDTNRQGELNELTVIYIKRGLDPILAHQVAEQLMAHDALGAHARDEIGINEFMSARPIQAAISSACSFAGGAALPLLITVLLVDSQHPNSLIALAALASLSLLGGLAAKIGGSALLPSIRRITFWGALAMTLSASIGHMLGMII